MRVIYLDHAATTATSSKVLKSMEEIAPQLIGNASSLHAYGRKAKEILMSARKTLAQSIAAKENEILLTSSGTEANNLALRGSAYALKDKGNHIITSQIEHPSVLNTCKQLEDEGFKVTYLPVDKAGLVKVQDLLSALTDTTILVSIMLINNELGTIQPVVEIGKKLAEKNIQFHIDAVQAYGIQSIDIRELSVDLLSTSAHKINGPQGIGFLYKKTDAYLDKQVFGGEQEFNLRAGTENIIGAVGFAVAIEEKLKAQAELYERYKMYRELMLNKFDDYNMTYLINGKENVTPNILNVSFPKIKSSLLITALDMQGVAVSAGSACSAGTVKRSHVLDALYGHESDQVEEAIRISLDLNTEKNVEEAAEKIANCILNLS